MHNLLSTLCDVYQTTSHDNKERMLIMTQMLMENKLPAMSDIARSPVPSELKGPVRLTMCVKRKTIERQETLGVQQYTLLVLLSAQLPCNKLLRLIADSFARLLTLSHNSEPYPSVPKLTMSAPTFLTTPRTPCARIGQGPTLARVAVM